MPSLGFRRSEWVFDRSFWVGEVDVRPLCLFRIALGAAIVLWYVDLLPDAGAFLTPGGVFPTGPQAWKIEGPCLCLLDGVESAAAATAFLVGGMAFALCLLVGFHTRAAAVFNFAFVASVRHRCLLVFGGADLFFQVLSFWMIFAPSERAWSIDAWQARRRGRPPATRAEAFPLRLLQLQIAWVYLASFCEKMAPEAVTWRSGTALHYALHTDDMYVRALGSELARFPWLTRAGTYATLAFELAFLPAVFSPVGQPYVRRGAVLAGLAFHLGIAVFLKIGWWAYAMPLAYLCFVDGPWLEQLRRWLTSRTLVPVPVEPPPPAPTESPVPPVGRRRSGQASLLLVFALGAAYSLHAIPRGTIPARVLEAVGLAQTWTMFSPNPAFLVGHLEVEGTLADGSKVDLVRAGFASGGIRGRYPYYEDWYASLWEYVSWAVERYHACAESYASWVARRYDASRAASAPRLTKVRVVWHCRETAPLGEAPRPWQDIVLVEKVVD